MYDDNTLQQFIQEHQIAAKIVRLSEKTATVVTAARALGVTPAQVIKSILFLVSGNPVLVIANGTAKIEPKRLAPYFDVGKRKVRMARPPEVETITGYSVGAMPPFGHKEPLITLVDPGVVEQEVIFGGGGTIRAMLRLTPQTLLEVTGGLIVPVTQNRPDATP